jgi:hypothetical protein
VGACEGEGDGLEDIDGIIVGSKVGTCVIEGADVGKGVAN